MHWKMILKLIKIHPKSIPNRPKWCPGALRKRSWKQVVFKLPKMALRLPRFFRFQVFAIIWRTSGVNLGAFWELSASVWVPKMATKLTHLAPKMVANWSMESARWLPRTERPFGAQESKLGVALGAKCVNFVAILGAWADALSSQNAPRWLQKLGSPFDTRVGGFGNQFGS